PWTWPWTASAASCDARSPTTNWIPRPRWSNSRCRAEIVAVEEGPPSPRPAGRDERVDHVVQFGLRQAGEDRQCQRRLGGGLGDRDLAGGVAEAGEALLLVHAEGIVDLGADPAL